MTSNTRKWLHGLGSAAITGIATSFTSSLGVQGAQLVGFEIETLKGAQLMVIALMGGLVGAAAYLRQSPLPPVENGM